MTLLYMMRKMRNKLYDNGQIELPLSILKNFTTKWNRKTAKWILSKKQGVNK